VRGYVLQIDNSIQPYDWLCRPSYSTYSACTVAAGNLVPLGALDSKRSDFGGPRKEYRASSRRRDTIMLQPLRRYCNASKLAGEVEFL